MIQTSQLTLAPALRIAYGEEHDCGKEDSSRDFSSGSARLLKTSLDLEVDDRHAPDYLLVTVNYGFSYKAEGWSRNHYTLKLYAGPGGELHYQTVAGNDDNLFSVDGKAQAGSFLRYTHAFQIYFYCLATYKVGNKSMMAQQRQSLCLKTF